MTHQHQSGATAESLSAENIALKRTITRLASELRNMSGLLRMLSWQDKPLTVEWTSTDGYYSRLGGDAREIAQREIGTITALLESEREAIEAAARVWPPTGGE